jgi:zinc protease
VKPNRARKVIIIDKPGSPQTTLRVGHIGVARSNPDHVPLTVMNTGLGGLFSSRINMNLREKHGYTYGASSAFLYRRGPGPFLIGTSVRTDVTAPAVREILLEIEKMRSSDVLPEELATAKDSIARSLAGLFETSPQAASTIGQLFMHNLPADYYRNLPGEIYRVTAADVRRVAEEYLLPEQTIIVAVGDRAKIREPLEELQFGPVECLDMDGNPAG